MWQYVISHTKCLLPTACTALTDDDGCNPVVEAELPALLSLIIAQISSKGRSDVGTLHGPSNFTFTSRHEPTNQRLS